MKCRILHETRGRMRVHVYKTYMTGEQADLLEAYLAQLEAVCQAKVDERTRNMVIRYPAPADRQRVIDALSAFDFENTTAVVPEHTGRALSRQYEDRMFFHIARRVISRTLLPAPVRLVITAAKACK